MHNRKMIINTAGYRVQNTWYSQTTFRFATAVIWFNKTDDKDGYAQGDLQDDFPDNLISYENHLEIFTLKEFMQAQLSQAIQLIQARQLYLKRPKKSRRLTKGARS